MKNIKDLKKWIPEVYILGSVAYYWIMTGTLFNIVAIVLFAVLIFLIVRKGYVLGICLSFVFCLLNLYMVLALISELNEFSVFNTKALNMLLVGGTYLTLNIVMSIMMLLKWGRMSLPKNVTHESMEHN